MLCFHHNDLDGKCAGAIVRKYIQEIFPGTPQKYIEVDYTLEFTLPKIVANESIYIVDYHFSPEIMREMCKFTSNIFVFDHHKTSKEVVTQYPKEVELHCDWGGEFSGCELVWNFLFPDKQMPAAVTLIGDRDAWKWVYGKQTASFNEGMMLYAHQPCDSLWTDLLSDDISAGANVQVAGDICIRYRDKLCEAYRDMWGYEAELFGHKCYVLNFVYPGASSESFGEKLKEYDVCVATVFKNGIWKLSFRSEGKVDVSEIAKRFPGGGGHAEAAGAEVKELPFTILEEK